MNKLCTIILNIMCVAMMMALVGTVPETLSERFFRAGIVMAYLVSLSCLIFTKGDKQ